MRYTYSEDQLAFAASAEALFAKSVTPTWQRAMWDDEIGREPGLWAKLEELGALAIMMPESLDGFGGRLVDVLPVIEAAGRHAVPDALIESVLLAPLALAWGGSTTQQEEYLGELLAGGRRATIALRERSLVPDAHVADLIVLPHDGELWVYRAGEVLLDRVHSQDPGRRLFRVTPVSGAGQRLPGGGESRARLEAVEHAANAALLTSMSQQMLDLSVEYARQRQQFGRLIGSFQAVKHLLADATSRVALATTATRAAACYHPPELMPALMARLVAVEAEALASHTALQVHGGIGFTFEHDLHIWLKRGKAIQNLHGGRAGLARRIGLAAVADF